MTKIETDLRRTLYSKHHRAEAAHKRDIDALCAQMDDLRKQIAAVGVAETATTTKESLGVGNRAKLRDEVCTLLAWAETGLQMSPDMLKEGTRECCEFVAMCCRAALAEPPRNCDVGTVDEQNNRHGLWCSKHDVNGDMEADCANNACSQCILKWGQMPYEEVSK